MAHHAEELFFGASGLEGLKTGGTKTEEVPSEETEEKGNDGGEGKDRRGPGGREGEGIGREGVLLVFSGNGTERAIGGHLAEASAETVGEGGLGGWAGDDETHLDIVLRQEAKRDLRARGRTGKEQGDEGGLGEESGGSGTLADGGEPIRARPKFSELEAGEKRSEWAGRGRRSGVQDGAVAKVGGGMERAIGANDVVGGDDPPGLGEIHAKSTICRGKDTGDEVELSGGYSIVGGGVEKNPSNFYALSTRGFFVGVNVKTGEGAIGEAVRIGHCEGGTDTDRLALGPKQASGRCKSNKSKKESIAHHVPTEARQRGLFHYSANVLN